MLTTDLRIAMQRIREFEKLQGSVASGELNATDAVKEHIVYRLNFYKATLRGVLAREYLDALERVRYLTNIVENMWAFNAPRNMDFLGEMLRRIGSAKEDLATAALAIKASANAGVI